MTKEQFHTVLGLTTLLIHRRKELDNTEKSAADYLRDIGAKDGNEPYAMDVLDWVREAVDNEGDDPEAAAKSLVESLHLEVE